MGYFPPLQRGTGIEKPPFCKKYKNSVKTVSLTYYVYQTTPYDMREI